MNDEKSYEIAEKALDTLAENLKKEQKMRIYTLIGIVFCVCFFFVCYFISATKINMYQADKQNQNIEEMEVDVDG